MPSGVVHRPPHSNINYRSVPIEWVGGKPPGLGGPWRSIGQRLLILKTQAYWPAATAAAGTSITSELLVVVQVSGLA